jgi:hypothetical protein
VILVEIALAGELRQATAVALFSPIDRSELRLNQVVATKRKNTTNVIATLRLAPAMPNHRRR